MCVRIKDTRGVYYSCREFVKQRFPGFEFDGFMRRESIAAGVWKNKLLKWWYVPSISGFSEVMPDNTIKDYERVGRLVCAEVWDKSYANKVIRFVTQAANNGSKHGREPYIKTNT